MAVPIPKLDDRTFSDLVAEARRTIPRLSAEWTDHNPSDPGVTLMELFAWLMETAIYRMDRIPEKSVEHFLKLAGTTRGQEPLAQAVQETLRSLSERVRAVTLSDFEILARQAAPNLIARAKAGVTTEGTLSVVILPTGPLDRDPPLFTPDQGLVTRVRDYLAPRRLITTRFEVVFPEYKPVSVLCRAARDQSTALSMERIATDIVDALWTFCHPLIGGWEGSGWEFGRNVFRSELCQVVERVNGVDYVKELTLQGDPTLVEIQVQPFELVLVARAQLHSAVED